MKQKILFNLFFKIYAKKVPLSRKTYIFVQNGSIYPKPELSFSAYPPHRKFIRKPSPFLRPTNIS